MKSLIDFANALDQLQEDLGPMPYKVNLYEILNDSFMKSHTKFHSFNEFLSSGGFGTTTEEFESVPEKVLDAYVQKNTDFNSWQELYESASNEYVSEKLGL